MSKNTKATNDASEGEYTPRTVFGGNTDTGRMMAAELYDQDGETLIVTKTFCPIPDNFHDDHAGTEGIMPGGTWKILDNAKGEEAVVFTTQAYTLQYAALLAAAFTKAVAVGGGPETLEGVTVHEWDKKLRKVVDVRLSDAGVLLSTGKPWEDADEEEEQAEVGEDTPHPGDSPEIWAGDGQAHHWGIPTLGTSPSLAAACDKADAERDVMHRLRRATGRDCLVYTVTTSEDRAEKDLANLAGFFRAALTEGGYVDAGWTHDKEPLDDGRWAVVSWPPLPVDRRAEARGILAAHGHDYSEHAVDVYLATAAQATEVSA